MAPQPRPMPEGFAEYAETHTVADVAKQFTMGFRTAKRLIELMPQDWQAKRITLMRERGVAIAWEAPPCFAGRCVNRSTEELAKFYRVSAFCIRGALAQQPPEVIAARVQGVRRRNVERLRAYNETRREKTVVADVSTNDRFVARYAAVAAKYGWHVHRVAA